MSFDLEICASSDPPEQFSWDTDIDVNHTAAAPAGEVMMMASSANSICMPAVAELDPIQKSLVDQRFNRPKNGRPADMRIVLEQIMPQSIGAKIFAVTCESRESLSNMSASTGLSLPLCLESPEDLLGNALLNGMVGFGSVHFVCSLTEAILIQILSGHDLFHHF